MIIPRLRMVAGPNGSGKSTLFKSLADKFPVGHWLNPDELELNLATKGFLDFTPWGVRVERGELISFVLNHPLAPRVAATAITLEENVLRWLPDTPHGYFVAVLADFMRRRWLATFQSFTFETVMSNGDKIEFLKTARASGFRTYLYYICTSSPLVNRKRVAARVRRGGHGVPREKIEERYIRSLDLLHDAIQSCDRAYIFDNSGKAHKLIAEMHQAKLVDVVARPPHWFVRAVLDKLP